MLKPSLLTTTAALFLGATANAQSIDYESLELVFGEPVTTSATGKPQRASDAPAAMMIISKEEIRRSGATTLPRILKRYAGIDVTQSSAEGYDVFVRGGVTSLNPGLLVLVDGRQVYFDHYGYTDWSALGVQLDDIQQVEVVKGPNSALFGFNAAVGVVNIVTKNPSLTEHRSFTVAAGPDGETSVSGVSTFKLGESVSARVSAGYRTADEFADMEDELLLFGQDYGGDPETFSFLFDSFIDISKNTELKLEASYSDLDTYIPLPTSNIPGKTQAETQSLRAQILHEGFGGLLKAGAYFNELEISVAAFTMEQSVLVANAEHIFKAGSADSFRVMGEYRHNKFQTVGASNPIILVDLAGEVGYDVLSVGGMWERVLSDTLTSTIALRLDSVDMFQNGDINPISGFTEEDFEQDFSDFSYNIGLVWKPTDLDTLRAIGSRGAQSPSLFALGNSVAFPSLTAPGGIVNLPGDPSMEPSAVFSYELGYVRALPDNMRLEVTAFYTDHQDIIQFSGTFPTSLPPETALVTYSQIQDGEYQTSGVEIGLRADHEESNWKLNYTFVDVQEDIPGQTFMGQPVLPVAFEDMTPKHRANLVYGRKMGKITGDIFVNYTSETSAPVTSTLGQPFTTREFDSSLTADLRVGYQLNDNFELFAVGENLFEDDAATRTIVDGETRARIGIRGTF